MLKFILHAVFEVPHSIPHWGTPAFHPTLTTLQTEVYHKNIKSKRKEVHIEFYYKLCDMLDEFFQSKRRGTA